MKAAWTCRACCRVLQQGQKPRPGHQDFAAPQLHLSRSYASEASVASIADSNPGNQNLVPHAAPPSRFSKAPRPSRPLPKPKKPAKPAVERTSQDLFKEAFKDRRGTESHVSKRGEQTTNHPDGPDEFLPPPPIAIPENYKFSRISLLQWRKAYSEIQAGNAPSWFSNDRLRWITKLEWDDMCRLWRQSTTEQRCLLWEWLALVVVVRFPHNTSILLEMRMMESLEPPRRHMTNDVFHLILQYLQKGVASPRALGECVRRTHRLLLRFLKTEQRGPGRVIWPATMGSFAKYMTRPQLMELYHVLKETGVPLTSNTELKFAYHLGGLRASDEEKRTAFELLQSYTNRGESLTDPKAASVITTLLHQTFLGEKSTFDVLRALQFFMEHGYLPNAMAVTAIVETLCERDDFPEAMHLMDLFKTNGLKFDEKACDILLKGARHSGDEAHLERALAFSKSTGAPQTLLAKHALHALYLRRQHPQHPKSRPDLESPDERLGREPQASREMPPLAEKNQKAFIDMLKFYIGRYDLSSLQSLIPKPLPYFLWGDGDAGETDSGQQESTLPTLLERYVPVSKAVPLSPCPETLALVLRAYVRSLWRPHDLMSMYSFFKQLLRDPEGAGVAASRIVRERGSFIHDSFILAMMQSPALVRPTLEVFADMIRDKDVHPRPSTHTFTNILQGLHRHREHKLFDDLKHILEENGVRPNLVTTNILVKSYASRQDMASTVTALQDLETLGYRPSAGTYHAFSKLKNEERALAMMSKIIEENKRKASTDRQ